MEGPSSDMDTFRVFDADTEKKNCPRPAPQRSFHIRNGMHAQYCYIMLSAWKTKIHTFEVHVVSESNLLTSFFKE